MYYLHKIKKKNLNPRILGKNHFWISLSVLKEFETEKEIISMYLQSITKEEIKTLPLKKFEGEILLVDHFSKVKTSIDYLKKQQILGFDTETKPSFKKGRINSVAVLQLATNEKAFIFRLNKIGLPNPLAKILSDSKIIKVGVAIKDDIRILKKLNHYMPDGFIDLQDFVKGFGIDDAGLMKLSAIILNFRISKAQQLSNWENDLLSESQLNYAATDAWVGYEIYKKLTNHTSIDK
jgi:ribonuclease D